MTRRSMADIASEIAAKHGLTLADFQSPTRRPRPSAARLEAYAALWNPKDRSRSAFLVGKFLGGRDPSTVIKGAQAYVRRLEAAE